ncbi:hypothetical protein [Sphingobacterium multivorum]|uniref:hypothetical protein n=1 Tax=Sphingobacterium multivorum TaxID=28454 RepID=UPI003DA5EEC5
MAIQITRQPENITLSRNPILFEFSTDKVILDIGRPLVFYLDFSNVENFASIYDWVNDVWLYKDWNFTLTIGRNIYQFACEYYPRADSYVIPHRIVEPSEPKSDWLGRVCEFLIQKYRIDNIFELNVEGEKIKIKSKKTTSNDISIENGDTESIVSFSITDTYVPISYTPNLKLFVELFSVDLDGTEKSVISAALAPDLSGKASWDFSKPLSSFLLETGTDRPSLYNVEFEKGKVIRTYFLQVTELYGEPQLARGSIRSQSFITIYGGLPKNLLGTTLVNLLTVENRVNFLTTSRIKKVTIDQPQWISWFNITDNLEDVKVNVELKYNDGSYYFFIAHNYESVGKFEKVIIPVGLDQIGANSLYPELSVVSYEITLIAGGKAVSESITYQVDSQYRPYKRFFLFQNSLGSYETFYTYGKKTNTLDFDKDSARVIQVRDFVLENGENIDLDITGQEKEKINTGYKSKAEIKAMRDFYLSKEKLTYVDGRWWPINLISSSVNEFEDGNGLFAQSFEISGQHLQEMFYED